MTDQLTTMICAQVIMMALSGAVGWLSGKIKGAQSEREKSKQEDAAERDRSRDIQRILLFHKIQDLFEDHVIREDAVTSAEKREIEELYNLYRQLGGNGEGERMYKELMALKTK